MFTNLAHQQPPPKPHGLAYFACSTFESRKTPYSLRKLAHHWVPDMPMGDQCHWPTCHMILLKTNVSVAEAKSEREVDDQANRNRASRVSRRVSSTGISCCPAPHLSMVQGYRRRAGNSLGHRGASGRAPFARRLSSLNSSRSGMSPASGWSSKRRSCARSLLRREWPAISPRDGESD